uniref:Putative secreted protein n=1 Tax=Anopheles triannulatus TaxID=58253 RepID=A0A2M4B6V7_9DIPT
MMRMKAVGRVVVVDMRVSLASVSVLMSSSSFALTVSIESSTSQNEYPRRSFAFCVETTEVNAASIMLLPGV